jgi:hypothetical protein
LRSSLAKSSDSHRRCCGHTPNSPLRICFFAKQLALCLERQVKTRRADDATRMTLVALSQLIGLAASPHRGEA